MKCTVLDYIKTLHAICLTGASTRPGGVSTSHGTTIHQDQDGFPLVPTYMSWDKVSKEDLEAMYWSQHYHKCQSLVPFQLDLFRVGLACGGKECQTPFQQLSLKQSDFILSKYLPLDTTLDSPWTMHHETMVKVFKHIAARQASYGIQDAFRSKAVLLSCKKGSLRPACYFDSNVEQVSPAPEVTNTNSQCKKGGRHWNSHKVAEQMLWGAQYLFTTISSQPNRQRGLAKDPASLKGPTANQCLELILASTYPPSSVHVGPVHTILAQALTLFYDLAFTIGQRMNLDTSSIQIYIRGWVMGFEFNRGLSRTFSTIINHNGALPNTLLATNSHLAPGPDGQYFALPCQIWADSE